MVVDRAKLSSSGVSAGPTHAPTPSPGPEGMPALLLGTDEDTKRLWKGLLRLFRHPVTLEARSAEELGRVPTGSGPQVLLIDAEAVDGGWETALRDALRRQPGLRVLLLTHDRSPERADRARAAGARVVLGRPFAMAEFERALEDAAEGELAGPGS